MLDGDASVISNESDTDFSADDTPTLTTPFRTPPPPPPPLHEAVTNADATPIPWFTIMPALKLEGASAAEANTLAKFRADLLHTGEKPENGLFGSNRSLAAAAAAASADGISVEEEDAASLRRVSSLPNISIDGPPAEAVVSPSKQFGTP